MKTKTWCHHIIWKCKYPNLLLNYFYWIHKGRVVPRSWRCCPICLAKRPKKKGK